MASGALVVEWIDANDPESGDSDRRRRALEAALAYFPGDRPTSVRLEARLAMVDWATGKLGLARTRLERVLGAGPDGIDRDLYAWVEILSAKVLSQMGRGSDALNRFKLVVDDEELAGGRRSMAAAGAAEVILAESPQDAIALLRGMTALPGGITVESQAALAHALLVAGRDGEVGTELAPLLLSDSPEAGEANLAGVLGAASAWQLPGDEPRICRLADVIAGLKPSPGAALASALVRSRQGSALVDLRARVRTLLASPTFESLVTLGAGDPAGISAIDRAFATAFKEGDARRSLRLGLKGLAAPGSDGDLPRRLWECARCAAWVERESPSFGSAACDGLLGLCDLLPAGQDYWIEGKFLRADRRSRAGDRVGEQAALNQVLSVAKLRRGYLAPACARLGASFEATGDDQKALETYALAESTVAEFGVGVNCLFRAALINLRLENDQEAIRLIGVLEDAPAAAVQSSSCAEQIKDLRALVKTNQASPCWVAGRKWWSEWQLVEPGLVEASGGPAERTPVISNLDRFEAQIRSAANRGDSKAYFRDLSVLVSAARWQPSLGSEVAALSAPVFHFAPDKSEKFRRVLISILEAPHPEQVANYRSRLLFLASAYLNARMPEKALRVAADFPPDRMGEQLAPTMHEIRGLAALEAGQDYAAAAAQLESDISQSGIRSSMVAGTLSDLYERMGRGDDAQSLLKRALAAPALTSDASGRADLQDRYTRLGRTASSAPAAPIAAVATADSVSPSAARAEAWVHSLALPWYALAAPAQIDDTGFQDMDVLLRAPERAFGPVDQIKFLLLAAQDPRVTPSQRQTALTEAAARLVLSAADYVQMQALARSAVDSPAFEDESRLRILWTLLAQLCEDGRREDYTAWRKNPLCDRFSPDLQRQLALLDLEIGVDRSSPDDVARAATSLSAGTLTWAGVQTMDDFFGFLLRSGDLARAEALADGVPVWKVSQDALSHLDSVRLDFARRLRAAREMNPMHEAMAQALLRSFPGAPEQLPAEYRDARISGSLPVLQSEAQFHACQYLAAARQFDRSDLTYWSRVFASLPKGPEGRAAGAELLNSGLSAATSDELRSELIFLYLSSADMDEPLIRQAAEKAFASYRSPSRCPLSYLAIRMYEIHASLRQGEAVDLQTAYSDLTDARVRVIRERDGLRLYTQTGDAEALKRTLGEIDSDTLLNPGFLPETIPAFAFLHMDAELSSAREAARRSIREDILASWAMGSSEAADRAVDLALALRDPTVLPAPWVTALGNAPMDPMVCEKAALVNAYLQSDWKGVEGASAALNREYPTRYSFYWYRGLALHNLGRDAAAVEALTTYVRHAKDELDYPRAVALLNTLAAGGARATAMLR